MLATTQARVALGEVVATGRFDIEKAAEVGWAGEGEVEGQGSDSLRLGMWRLKVSTSP